MLACTWSCAYKRILFSSYRRTPRRLCALECTCLSAFTKRCWHSHSQHSELQFFCWAAQLCPSCIPRLRFALALCYVVKEMGRRSWAESCALNSSEISALFSWEWRRPVLKFSSFGLSKLPAKSVTERKMVMPFGITNICRTSSDGFVKSATVLFWLFGLTGRKVAL